MQKRKILSILVAICLIINILALPVIADTQESTQTVTPPGTQATAQDLEPNSSSNSPGDDSSNDNNSGGAQSTSADVQSAPGGEQPSAPANNETPAKSDSVKVETNTNVDITIDGRTTATTGQGASQGNKAENQVSDSSHANAMGDSNSPGSQGQSDVVANNTASQSIDNSGTAESSTGKAQASNTMIDNTATISPDTTATVDVLGKIIDSTVTVSLFYNYWAAVTGYADALTGDSLANGLISDNSANNTATALAVGDSPSLPGGGTYDGSAFAKNNVKNSISNKGEATSLTGDADAANTMIGNTILIAPIVGTIIKLCGDIVNSNVVIDLVYNFLAAISGLASAKTGDSAATGADVDNSINNYSSAKAMGDAPAVSGTGLNSDGSAFASNDTGNTILNEGDGLAVSGDASASNTMVGNGINISPAVTSELDFLDDIVNSDVLFTVTYNFFGGIQGSANAVSGDTTATGVAADNSVDSTSTAKAVGDSPTLPFSGGGDGGMDGEAAAANVTNNSINNTGTAVSASGDAQASNTMNDNTVDISPELYTIIKIAKPIVDKGKVIINIVYDVWSMLSGSADANTGNAVSGGSISANSIGSDLGALALADVEIGKPDGLAVAGNSSSNSIENGGLGVAVTGDAGAANNMSEASTTIAGPLQENLTIGDCNDSTSTTVSLKAGLSQDVDALSGNAASFGDQSLSSINSNADAKAIFGQGAVAFNESDKSIVNNGTAKSLTGDANASAGKPLTGDEGGSPVDEGTSGGNDSNKPGPPDGDNGNGPGPVGPGLAGDQVIQTGDIYGIGVPRIIGTKLASAIFRIPGYRGGKYLGEGYSLSGGFGPEVGEDYLGNGKGARHRERRPSATGSASWWIWVLLALLLTAWGGVTLKTKPWQYIRSR